MLQDEIPAREKVTGRSRARLLKKAEEKRRNDDPYYCGFSARVPAFNNKKVPRERAASRDVVGQRSYCLNKSHEILSILEGKGCFHRKEATLHNYQAQVQTLSGGSLDYTQTAGQEVFMTKTLNIRA